MASYVITGASRGLGYEFLTQLSSNPSNTVIGLVRNKEATDVQLAADKLDSLPNLHVIQADATSLPALEAALPQIKTITPTIDVLIHNAASVPWATGHLNLSNFPSPETLAAELIETFTTNVVGVVNTTNILMPLVLASKTKKVIIISTGMADLDLVNEYEVDTAASYSISKAAVNMAVAKYNARYAKDGVLFMAISPGVVDTGNTPKQKPDMELVQKFMKYAPHFTGPITPAQSVEAVMKVIENASVEKGDGGSFVSHFGTKQWL